MADLDSYKDVMVLCGPVVGTVTSTSAVVLLEVDEAVTITIVLTSQDHMVRQKRTFPSRHPRAFFVQGLKPDTLYTYSFHGLGGASTVDIGELETTIRTFPENPTKIRIVAQSCDRPRRVLEGDENPWDRLVKEEYDIMLHLGDQVYTEMDGFLERAVMKMRRYKHPATSQMEKRKMLKVCVICNCCLYA